MCYCIGILTITFQNYPQARKMAGPQPYEGTLAFDNLDIDLILKVASHTVFGPFFTFFVPVIYKGIGAPCTAPTVYYSLVWFLFVTSICALLVSFMESSHHLLQKGCSSRFRTSIVTSAH